MDSGSDAYHEGYQARQQGKSLASLPDSTDKKYISGWRTGWMDADHDLTYTARRTNEPV